jgi:four helix bundle protein
MLSAPVLWMAGARRFEDLIVWQLSVRIRDRIDALVESGPVSRDFRFRDQIRDACASAPRNIAEGFLRFNPPEFAYFMNIARSSLGETQNHLLHAKERKYLNEKAFEELWRLTCRALKAANRLHAYLREQSQKSAAPKEPKAPREPKASKEPEAPPEPQEP